MEIKQMYERTHKYRSIRDRTKNISEQTLVRIAKSNAKALEDECENVDEFYGVVMAMNHSVVTVSLYDQITNGANPTVKEIYALQVAILGELFLTESGKELRKLHG